MEVTLLSTGSALLSPDRVQTGIHLRDGDRELLIDCGSGVLHRLGTTHDSLASLDTVLLTYHHLDHVAELAKTRLLRGHGSVSVVGPPGTAAVCDALFTVDGLRGRCELSVSEITPGDTPTRIAGFEVRAVDGTHSKRCFAYRLGDAYRSAFVESITSSAS